METKISVCTSSQNTPCKSNTMQNLPANEFPASPLDLLFLHFLSTQHCFTIFVDVACELFIHCFLGSALRLDVLLGATLQQIHVASVCEERGCLEWPVFVVVWGKYGQIKYLFAKSNKKTHLMASGVFGFEFPTRCTNWARPGLNKMIVMQWNTKQ